MHPALQHAAQLPGADPGAIATLERGLGVALAEDYKTFLMASDGFNDDVGAGYLVLWSLAELAHAGDYEIFPPAPDRILIGSNGGPTAYGIVENAYVALPFVASGDWRAEMRILGDTFDDFITAIANGDGW